MQNKTQTSRVELSPRVKKLVRGITIAVILLMAVSFILKEKKTDPKKYAHLVEPRLTELAPGHMLVVTAKGDPLKTAGRAIGFLYSACRNTNGCVRDAAPRARWPEGLTTPREKWTGRFALPVDSDRPALPDKVLPAGFGISLQTWTYGEAAEILHVGPYSKESRTEERLKAFIEKSGYAIAGEHEEEYVKGPGMVFDGDPEKYMTVLRYSVKKKN